MLAADVIRQGEVARVELHIVVRGDELGLKPAAADEEEQFVVTFLQRHRQADDAVAVRIADARLAVDVDHCVAAGFEDHHALGVGRDLP